MGTRNLTCVVYNNDYKVAQYGQWDGYPEGQGANILYFLKNEMNRKLFIEKLNAITWISKEELEQRWVNAGATRGDNFVSMEVVRKHTQMYPESSRDTGAGILKIIQNSGKPLKLKNDIDFAKDSVFCEYAYVINLDKNILEVYKGFNKFPLTKEDRFFDLQENNTEFYPVKKIIEFDINNLPELEEFTKEIYEKIEKIYEKEKDCRKSFCNKQ